MAKPTYAVQVLDYIRANAGSAPEVRCEVEVATALSSDTRGVRCVMRVIGDLVYKGTIERRSVGCWAQVLSLPEVEV